MKDLVIIVAAFIDSPAGKIVTFVLTLLGLVPVFLYYKRKAKNRLRSVEIGGSFTGGSRGVQSDATSSTTNDLRKVKISGDYTGGDKK